MNKPRDIRFSFDNVDVARRFVDAVFAIPNMGGVTIYLEDAPQEAEEEPETADNSESTQCLSYEQCTDRLTDGCFNGTKSCYRE